jgi:tellurite resistance protein TehA-like permease
LGLHVSWTPPRQLFSLNKLLTHFTAYTSLALITLGSRAQKALPPDFLGITSVPVGDLLKVLGVFSGIFIWLLGFWFSMLSSLAVVAGLKRFSFDLTWWAFIFPNAGLTLAAIQIGEALHSPGINDVTSAMTIVLVILWLVVAGANIKAFWEKKILMPGKDEVR